MPLASLNEKLLFTSRKSKYFPQNNPKHNLSSDSNYAIGALECAGVLVGSEAGMREFNHGQEVGDGQAATGELSLCDYSPPLIQALSLWRGRREINGLKENISAAQWFSCLSLLDQVTQSQFRAPAHTLFQQSQSIFEGHFRQRRADFGSAVWSQSRYLTWTRADTVKLF